MALDSVVTNAHQPAKCKITFNLQSQTKIKPAENISLLSSNEKASDGWIWQLQVITGSPITYMTN